MGGSWSSTGQGRKGRKSRKTEEMWLGKAGKEVGKEAEKGSCETRKEKAGREGGKGRR